MLRIAENCDCTLSESISHFLDENAKTEKMETKKVHKNENETQNIRKNANSVFSVCDNENMKQSECKSSVKMENQKMNRKDFCALKECER